MASTLDDIVPKDELDEINSMFMFFYNKYYFENMTSKFGIFDQDGTQINKLIEDLLDLMEHSKVDYTQFFHRLSKYKNRSEILDIVVDRLAFDSWLDRYENILKNESITKEQREEKLKKINPKYTLKNYMIQEAIDKANHDDFSLVEDLMKIAQNPYGEHSAYERYAGSTPQDYSNKMLSCSS